MQKEAKANIVLENSIKITKKNLDEFGNNFEKTENGFTDFLHPLNARALCQDMDGILASKI